MSLTNRWRGQQFSCVAALDALIDDPQTPHGDPIRQPLHGKSGSLQRTRRPVKSFDAILNAVVMELQRTHCTKVKLTLENEAEATGGFAESKVSVVRDNARQLKFKAESTGFEE